jgi:hypothetical protein
MEYHELAEDVCHYLAEHKIKATYTSLVGKVEIRGKSNKFEDFVTLSNLRQIGDSWIVEINGIWYNCDGKLIAAVIAGWWKSHSQQFQPATKPVGDTISMMKGSTICVRDDFGNLLCSLKLDYNGELSVYPRRGIHVSDNPLTIRLDAKV